MKTEHAHPHKEHEEFGIKHGLFVKFTKHITHAELLKLIGEIDGISLESKEGCVVVNLEVNNQKIEIIRDYPTNICHSITRAGIANLLANNLKK